MLLAIIHLGSDGPAEATADGNSILRVFIIGTLDEALLGFGCAVVHPELVKASSDVEDTSVEVSHPADGATELINHHLGKDHLTEGHRVSKALVDVEGYEGNEMMEWAHQEVEEPVMEDTLLSEVLLFLLECFNRVDELVFPAEELDALDIADWLVHLHVCFVA